MRIINHFFTLALVVLLIVLLFFPAKYFYSQAKIVLTEKRYNWKETVATIEKISLIDTATKELSGDLAEVFPVKNCHIEYLYMINKKEYISTSIGLNKNKYKQEYLFNEVNVEVYNKLRKAKKITIYVNPENPTESVIVKYDFDYKELGKGLILLIFPLIFFYVIFEYKKYSADYISSQIQQAL